MTSLIRFVRHETARLRFRLEILWRGVVAACLWLLIAVLWSFAAPAGLGLVVITPLAVLAVLGLPVLVVQVGLLVDLLLYVIGGEIAFYPTMLESVRASARRRADEGAIDPWDPPRAIRVLVWTVDALSPLAAPATWAFCVLARIPESAHTVTAEHPVSARRHSPGRSLRRVESSMLARSWGARGPLAA